MADKPNQAALDASRLPDLPEAGYSTSKERQLTDAIMFLIRGIERDRLLLLDCVLAGRNKWRKVFKNSYRYLHADDEFADAIFGYLVLLAGPNPDAQKAQLQLKNEQAAVRAWDHRLSTALKQSKDTQALLKAIYQEEVKGFRKPVRFVMGGK